MRIAVWHNLPSGGGKRALYDHVKGLTERGHTLEAWCPSTADTSYLPLDALIPEHVVPFEELGKRGWHDTIRLRGRHQRLISAMELHCRTVADQINQGGFDVLFANSCFFLGAAPIGRYVHGPKVLYLQEPYRPLYEAMPNSPWAAMPSHPRTARHLAAEIKDWLHLRGRRMQVREEITNAAAYDRLLVNSYYSRESVLRAYGLDAEVCYLGVESAKTNNPAAYRSELPAENSVIGVGAVVPLKNIEFIIRALAQIRTRRPRLIWVGNVAWSPDYLQQLRDLAESLSVAFEPHIRVSNEELLHHLRRAFAFVYAPRLEPFGLAPIEAALVGLPVIAVAEGGVRETVVDGVTGILVASNVEHMANAITRLQENPVLASALGKNGRERALNQWSTKASIDRLERYLMRTIHAETNYPHTPAGPVETDGLPSPHARAPIP